MKKKKAHRQPPIVTKVIDNWRQMYGKNTLEKRLNALITDYFVIGSAPKDECISITQKITKLKNPNRENIYKLLYESFGQGVEFNGDSEEGKMVDLRPLLKNLEPQLQSGTTMILYLLKLLK